ncbi:DNA repair/transcription protein met18/mms19 [Operophtera brumata]|uniref:MMS19 nucleotide excision repair protein n=1 Tax=Operophtera brumata TaxID=104452 RepID=A0A0L7L8Z2_OPEBR|nr:DNA repair/transcription protein met18/mms19 [Operophtera brumata]
MSNSNLYTDNKLSEIESNHGINDSILRRLLKKLKTGTQEILTHGYTLISNTSLPVFVSRSPCHEKPELADKIVANDGIFEQTQSIISDMISGHIDITHLLENMEGVLTNKEAENREKGMRFFTKILKELPKDYLTETQIKFISKFYVDRLKDNHRVIPNVLDGYLTIVDMAHYNINCSSEFFTVLFREVACQSQVRQDRDPRNLMFLFTVLPKFIKNIPMGHLVEEVFDVISCYYPVDFHPSPDDPAAVSRQDLATALAPCLCASQEFAELCLVLLVEKLDSSLRLAKIDSLKLLIESCKTFNAQSYAPFLKALWPSIHREMTHKTDEELKMVAHEALLTLTAKLASTANTDQAFENFIKGILIGMQSAVADSKTVTQFVQATKVLLTAANSSKEACVIITKSMIPATFAYYEFNVSPMLQIASLQFLGDLYDIAKHWEILDQMQQQVKEIPQMCLTAVSNIAKEYQIAGFRTLVRVMNVLDTDLVVPFVEVLVNNIQHSQDDDLLRTSVETIHAIARKYPELIMGLVVKGKCNLDNMTQDNVALKKRLNLLSNLASIDDFTKVIIQEMLKMITTDNNANQVVEAMSESMSNSSLYTHKKVAEIESDYGLIDSVLRWLQKELKTGSVNTISHGYTLISNTISSLPIEKQQIILSKHTADILPLCEIDNEHFLLIESLYNSVHKELHDPKFDEIMKLSLNLSLNSENDVVRTKACAMVAHFMNKAEYGQKFELLYEFLKDYLSSSKRDPTICPRLILLYAWITKALILRGSDTQGAAVINLIMTDFAEHLNPRQHCRISLLYKQRMFVSFMKLTETMEAVKPETKEAYLLSWALQTILPRLTTLSNYVKSMDVRIKSLQCLFEIAHIYRTTLLLPYKQDVLFDLAPSLDDKKRLVRNMAVRARTRWFLIGAPGEAKED